MLVAHWFEVALFGILGLAVGSFLNVVIHRLPKIMERQWEAEYEQSKGEQAFSRETYNLLVAALIPVLLWKLRWAPSNVALAGASVLGGWRPLFRVWFEEGAALNPGLAQPALLLLFYSLIFSAGWLV